MRFRGWNDINGFPVMADGFMEMPAHLKLISQMKMIFGLAHQDVVIFPKGLFKHSYWGKSRCWNVEIMPSFFKILNIGDCKETFAKTYDEPSQE